MGHCSGGRLGSHGPVAGTCADHWPCTEALCSGTVLAKHRACLRLGRLPGPLVCSQAWLLLPACTALRGHPCCCVRRQGAWAILSSCGDGSASSLSLCFSPGSHFSPHCLSWPRGSVVRPKWGRLALGLAGWSPVPQSRRGPGRRCLRFWTRNPLSWAGLGAFSGLSSGTSKPSALSLLAGNPHVPILWMGKLQLPRTQPLTAAEASADA